MSETRRRGDELRSAVFQAAIAEITGLYNWVSAGDVALVDADHGLLRVNPTRKERDEARLSRDAARDGGDEPR